MNLDETLRLKALRAKELHQRGSDMADQLLDHLAKDAPEQLRNICAHISVPLFDEVDQLCSLLEMSKRRFVELALVDAVQKAHAILHEVQPFELKED